MFTLRICDDGLQCVADTGTAPARGSGVLLGSACRLVATTGADAFGCPVMSGPVVVESFARGDRVYVRGALLEKKDPAIKAVSRCVTQWSPPPVDQLSAPGHEEQP